jgi:hypothetical protein
MESVVARLAVIWQRLQQSNLVRNRLPTPENIAEFTRLLNMSVAITDTEIGAGQVMRVVFHKRGPNFTAYLRRSGLAHMLLMTEGSGITDGLCLKGVVTIQWRRERDVFVVFPASARRITGPSRPVAVAPTVVPPLPVTAVPVAYNSQGHLVYAPMGILPQPAELAQLVVEQSQPAAEPAQSVATPVVEQSPQSPQSPHIVSIIVPIDPDAPARHPAWQHPTIVSDMVADVCPAWLDDEFMDTA